MITGAYHFKLKTLYRFLLTIPGILGPICLIAQTLTPGLDSVRQKITNSLLENYKNYPQEKIFLHTDNNLYLSGQTAWYKVYAMAYGKPSKLSRIVYVRFSDMHGKIIRQDKLPLINSTAYGNLTLSDSIKSGWYRLQAFTAWMLNFDEKEVYHSNIFIQNTRDNVNNSLPLQKVKTYSVSYYPEGGDLVNGNICTIAFRAKDNDGQPVNIFGSVLDDNNKPVAQLMTLHDGMGRFDLEIDQNKKYKILVRFPDNSTRDFDMPKIKSEGISMRVRTAANNELELKIAYADQKKEHRTILLEATQNNGLSATYPLRLGRGTNVINLKKADFSTGILRLTLFNENGLPEAERIVFINNNDQLKLSLSRDTISHRPKSKNVVELDLKDDKGAPLQANLSVSVTDALVGGEPEQNIGSYFLMSSELRGQVYRPGYYFKNNSDTLQQQLDLVMLTNGWRRFKWDTILNARPRPLKYFVENSQVIAGQIVNYHAGDNLKIKLMITGADSSKIVGIVEPDSTGNFILKDYNHQGTANMSYQVVNAKNKKQPVKITFFKQDVDTLQFSRDTLIDVAGTALINRLHQELDSLFSEHKIISIKNSIVLKGVDIKAKKLSPTQLLLKNHVQRLTADNAYTLDLVNSNPPSGDIIQYIRGRFPGLEILPQDDGNFVFKYRGTNDLPHKKNNDGAGAEVHESSDANKPFFYIDEAQVTFDDVNQLSMSEVALIRFAPPPVWFAPMNGGFNGAILIYTKKYGDEKSAASGSRKGFEQYTFDSFSVTREFPLTEYNNNSVNGAQDFRTTLFWSHDLNTDGAGKVKVRFYNSDNAKKYRIVVQSMDKNGKVGYLMEEF